MVALQGLTGIRREIQSLDPTLPVYNLRTLLFGVSATDPLTFAAIAAVSLAACWIPARRAIRVGGLVAALRND
jgi:ABC-type lipoprotein release transport system permease subunit